MIGFLLKRPIAVFLAFIVSIIIGLFLFKKIPVSLLPNIDVPKVIVKINYPNTSADVIEENVTKKIRDNFITLDKVAQIESKSSNHTATIELSFEYGTKMDLSYIAVNERLDRLINYLPKDLDRPQVVRLNTSDIPIIRIQLVPKNSQDYLRISELTNKVIKKRIEQIDGVSIVDINGKQEGILEVSPNKVALNAIGLTEFDLENAIKSANSDIGSLSIKDGQFKFFVKLANKLENANQIAEIPLRLKDGTTSSVGKFATIEYVNNEPQGYHLYKGKESLVLTVQKQSNARMNDLVPKIDDLVKVFKQDYPRIDFFLTQDQTFLLNEGIGNLTQDLWFAGGVCILLLFLFLGNYASPILMGISIPVSLLLTFIFFYLFGISFNIISLSGLALGIGMLIDNSIVVLDSITRRRREGLSIDDSCILGVEDVVSPVISNVLTTVAIYAPLIYLSGLAGALIFDQAIALTISLAVSLLVAFCLNPVMYKYLLKNDSQHLKEDTRFYLAISGAYHKMINHVFKFKVKYFVFTLLIMPLGFVLFYFVPISTLPKITETDTQLKIDWNSSIDAKENSSRIQKMATFLDQNTVFWEADIGIKQFLFQNENSDLQQSELFYKCVSEDQKLLVDQYVSKWFKDYYPDAMFSLNAAPNAFTQLFDEKKPYVQVRLRPFNSAQTKEADLERIVAKIDERYSKGLSFVADDNIVISLNRANMLLYGISFESIKQELVYLFGNNVITELKRFGESMPIKFSLSNGDIQSKLTKQIQNDNGSYYPLSTFLNFKRDSSSKYILADQAGVFQSINFQKSDIDDVKEFQTRLENLAANNGHSVSFSGSYYDNQVLMQDMLVIFTISLLLLYFILAVQFENLVHPLLVMFTIPLGIGGAMLFLWAAGGTLNIMAAIGFIVVLGIIVDDPSLKVETINRLRKEYLNSGMTDKREILLKALHNAGEMCLKPLLMVSLTTSLALLPVFLLMELEMIFKNHLFMLSLAD